MFQQLGITRLISAFWNLPEFLFFSCFYDDVELICVMTIYCSLLHWIIAYCLLLSLTLDPHLLFKCFPCFLFWVSTSQKWVFTASNCQCYCKLFQTSGNFIKFCQGNEGIIRGFFFRHLAGNPGFVLALLCWFWPNKVQEVWKLMHLKSISPCI